jgi:hypothetical protein
MREFQRKGFDIYADSNDFTDPLTASKDGWRSAIQDYEMK